jgi:hypothetical protein
MPTFNMAAQTPNGQPGGTEAVYTNGIPQTYPARKFILSNRGRLSISMDNLPNLRYCRNIRTELTEMQMRYICPFQRKDCLMERRRFNMQRIQECNHIQESVSRYDCPGRFLLSTIHRLCGCEQCTL